jgi:hypothetical protein
MRLIEAFCSAGKAEYVTILLRVAVDAPGSVNGEAVPVGKQF